MGVGVINTGKSKTSENYNYMGKNEELESKMTKEDVEAEFSNEVLLASADESERECNENVDGQRASFPQVYCEMECSQVFYEDGVSSGGGVEDEVSSDGPLVFCGLPGRGNKSLMVPFALNEIVQGRCV